MVPWEIKNVVFCSDIYVAYIIFQFQYVYAPPSIYFIYLFNFKILYPGIQFSLNNCFTTVIQTELYPWVDDFT